MGPSRPPWISRLASAGWSGATFPIRRIGLDFNLSSALAAIAGGLALGCMAAWLAAALGSPLPLPIARGLVTLGAIALLAYLAVLARRLAGDRILAERGAGLLLLLLVVLAFAVYTTGLGFELGGRYFGDEGIFLNQARRINQGQVLRGWFVYPHLLFYADAFALWVASLFWSPIAGMASWLAGLHQELYVSAWVTRWVTAAFGAASVVPTFLLARRLAGRVAGALAGLLLVVSPVYLEISQLNIADPPSAFFAILCLALTARLLERETWSAYLAAGAAAGLAAGSKYPAGLVAVAIVALFVRHRWREFRRVEPAPATLRWGGLGAAAGIGGLILSTPSLVAFPSAAAGGTGADLLFGARLYAEHGWPGVVRASNLSFYAGELTLALGAPALVCGLVGLQWLDRKRWIRLAWMLPFPLVYLLLLLAMKIALRRNLLPLIPVVAVILGVGLASIWSLTDRWKPAFRSVVRALFVVAMVGVPSIASATHLASTAFPTTREQASAWAARNLPPGAFVVQEGYTPQLAPPLRLLTRRPRLAIKIPFAELTQPDYDVLFLSSESYNRFLRPDLQRDPSLGAPAARYRELFERLPLMARFAPDFVHGGPEILVYQLDPPDPRPQPELRFEAANASLADEVMREPASDTRVGRAVRFGKADQWAAFKGFLAAGSYRVALQATLGSEAGQPLGHLEVWTREGGKLAEASGTEGLDFTLARHAKAFFFLTLPEGSALEGLSVEPIDAPGR